MALYEQINDSIAAVTNWSANDWSNEAWYATMLHQLPYSAFNTLIDTYKTASNWDGVARVKRQTEFLGYTSPTIDVAVKALLAGVTMFVNYAVPETAADKFYPGYPVIHGYRWAKELSTEETKWDAQDGYDGLHEVLTNESDCFWQCDCDAGPPPTGDQVYGGRLYEKNMTACTFWDLWKSAGVEDAKEDFKQCWSYFLTHWNESALNPPDRFDYAKDAGWDGWVWDGVYDALNVFGRFECDRYGESLTNFSYLADHMGPGYLDSKFGSRHWIVDGGTQYEVVVHLNSSTFPNTERRITGTMGSYCFLHQMWNRMTATQQANFQDMLKGTTGSQAWQALIHATAGLFDSGTDKFKVDSGDATTDRGTALGSALMFLLGICPETGSLALPLRAQVLGQRFMFGPDSFRWDADHNKIKIAVFRGKLTFMYGSTNTDYTFPRDGVYNVYFTDDYNTIQKVVQIGELPGKYYLDYPIHGHFKSNLVTGGLVQNLVWRRATLGPGRCADTGWFDVTWSEIDITGIVGPINASVSHHGAGSYTSYSCILATAYPVRTNDQVIVNNRYFTVEDVMESHVKGRLEAFQARLVQTPLREES